MEQEHMRSYVRKGLIALGVFVLIAAVALLSIPRRKVTLPELSQYLPASTVFALRADRASVMGPSHRLIAASEQLRGWQDAARTYWQNLEELTGFKIDTLLIAVTEDRGILWQSILFSTADTITMKKTEALANQPYDALAWYPPSTDSLHFQRIGDHAGGILSVQDTQDYTSPSSQLSVLLSSDPIAISMKQDIGQQIADMLGAEQIVPGLTQLIRSQERVRAGVSLAEPLIRVTMFGASATTTPVTDIRVPAMFDLAFVGDTRDVFDGKVPTSHPLSAAMQSFINKQATALSFKPEDLKRDLRAVDAFIVSGDQWLMRGTDSANIADLVSLFIGAETPKRMIGKLPDGSPYREIVRGMPVPHIEDVGGLKVSVWSGATARATSTSGNSSEQQALYTIENEGKWYLATNKELLNLQFDNSEGAGLKESELSRACQSQGGSDIVEFGEMWNLSAASGSAINGESVKLAFIAGKNANNEDIHSICIE